MLKRRVIFFNFLSIILALCAPFRAALLAGIPGVAETCGNAGSENGVPRCSDEEDYAITHYFMGVPHFRTWTKIGKKFDHLIDEKFVENFSRVP